MNALISEENAQADVGMQEPEQLTANNQHKMLLFVRQAANSSSLPIYINPNACLGDIRKLLRLTPTQLRTLC